MGSANNFGTLGYRHPDWGHDPPRTATPGNVDWLTLPGLDYNRGQGEPLNRRHKSQND